MSQCLLGRTFAQTILGRGSQGRMQAMLGSVAALAIVAYLHADIGEVLCL